MLDRPNQDAPGQAEQEADRKCLQNLNGSPGEWPNEQGFECSLLIQLLQEMIKTESGTETKYLDASNRFFTLIPHDFGLKSPPILQEADYIKV